MEQNQFVVLIEAPLIPAALLWVIWCNKIMTGHKVQKSIITLIGASVLVPGWTYSVALDLHGSSLYFLTIPNLGLRCTNIPAQYPMLVRQRPRHTSEPRRSDDNPGGAILTPSQEFMPKYAPIATGWLLRHVWLLNMRINVLHLWLPAQAGQRPCRSETIGVAARKMSEYFCARRHPPIGFLVRFGFTTKWISWNWSRKVVLDFSNCSGPSEPVFSLQIGFLKMVEKSSWKPLDGKKSIVF